MPKGPNSYRKNFAKIYTKYSAQIKNYLYSYLKNWDTAEEILHDIFAKLISKKIFIKHNHPTTLNYLYRVARNHATDYIRKANKVKFKQLDYLDEIELTDQLAESLEKIVIDGSVINTLHNTINSLPEEKKEICIEKLIDGKNYQDICKEKKISYYKIKKTISEINNTLRESVAEYYCDK